MLIGSLMVLSLRMEETEKVAATILNKQSRTSDKGWPSTLGVWREANNPHHKI